MTRTTRKTTNPTPNTRRSRPLTRLQLREVVKSKMVEKSTLRSRAIISWEKLDRFVSEETLSCAICLQLLLKPVLAQCGHTCCLSCAEELALHNYACGICHSHSPTFDLKVCPALEQLVNKYLRRRSEEEQADYARRIKEIQLKESSRKVGTIYEDMLVDLWDEQDHKWKEARVSSFSSPNSITVRELKSGSLLDLPTHSRLLARHRCFTKQEPEPAVVRHPLLGQVNRAEPFAFFNMPRMEPGFMRAPLVFLMNQALRDLPDEQEEVDLWDVVYQPPEF